MCSTSGDTRRDEYATCTAVAADAVLAAPPRGRQGPLRHRINAQIYAPHIENPLVNATNHPRVRGREPSRVVLRNISSQMALDQSRPIGDT
jgi:hypothetical protein